MRSAIAGILGVLVLSGALRADAPDGNADEERWYVLMLQDARAGHLHERVSIAEAKQTLTTSMRLSIRRGDDRVNIAVDSESVETADGQLLRMSSTNNMGAGPVRTTYVFREGKVGIETIAADGRTSRRTAAAPPGDWLAPLKAAHRVQERLDAGASTITVRTIDPATGLKPIRYTRTVVGRSNVEVLGRSVPAIRWSSVVDLYPDIVNHEFVDERGRPILSEIRLGTLRIEVVLADKELALGELDPPELMASTLVRPNRPIVRPRGITHAVYRLRATPTIDRRAQAEIDRPRPLSAPSTSAQTVETLEDGSLRITVDARSTQPSHATDCTDPALLQSSVLIDHDHPTVRSALQAFHTSAKPHRRETSREQRIEALRRYVHDYVRTKSLGVGFASASQVAQSREGDCTEHAVFLCALLRAEGIPARVVSGLVYVDEFLGESGVFGYHMWTQAAIIDPKTGACRWIDVDASLGTVRGFDATHIALEVSTLGEEESVNAMVRLAPLLGTLSVDVIETRSERP